MRVPFQGGITVSGVRVRAMVLSCVALLTVAAAARAATAEDTKEELKPVNLLAPSQGGQAIVVPNDEWLKPINGKDDNFAGNVLVGQEAVYAFKNEKPAAFWKFAVLISATNGGNPKEIEVLAGDSPTGTFRSLGKFPILNVKMVKSPFQEFAFPKTTARYVKIKLLANYLPNQSWGFNLPQIRIIGRPVQ